MCRHITSFIMWKTVKPGWWLLGLNLLLLSALLPLASASDGFHLPEIGDSSGSLLTPAQEQRLGQAFMRSVRNHYPVVSDPLIADYIQSLGDRLASNSEAAGQPFHFFLIDSPAVNAFAGPAGHIGIFSGLVLTTETESELASVVAHEIAHVTQKHLLRTFDDASRMNLPIAAISLAAILVGGGTDLGAAAAMGLQAGMLQRKINFTRANEHEADRIGINTLANADFDPRAMPVFFGRMGRATRFYGSTLPEFLRTHPVTTTRISDSRGRAEAYPYKQYPADVRYYLLRVTLREQQYEKAKDAIRFFRETLADGRYRNEAAQRYGYVLALMRAKDLSLARKELDKLLEAYPNQIAYQLLNARLYTQSGEPEIAALILETALNEAPDNYPITMAYAQTLIAIGKPVAARKILEHTAPHRPRDAALYKLLAQATAETGDTSQAHEYQADFYYISGRLEQAKQQLMIALQDKSVTLFREERMSAQLKQIQSELVELKRRHKK